MTAPRQPCPVPGRAVRTRLRCHKLNVNLLFQEVRCCDPGADAPGLWIGFSAYANLAYSKARGNNIVSSQYKFAPDELDYIAYHFIYLDHGQTWTGSAGASYLWNETTLSVSALYGSRLRRGFANAEHLSPYWQVNLGAFRPFDLPWVGKTIVRLSVVNVFAESYKLRDGTGVGVGAPQYGPRRAFYVSIEKPFNW